MVAQVVSSLPTGSIAVIPVATPNPLFMMSLISSSVRTTLKTPTSSMVPLKIPPNRTSPNTLPKSAAHLASRPLQIHRLSLAQTLAQSQFSHFPTLKSFPKPDTYPASRLLQSKPDSFQNPVPTLETESAAFSLPIPYHQNTLFNPIMLFHKKNDTEKTLHPKSVRLRKPHVYMGIPAIRHS
jgi:hypothetical protein